MGLSQIGKKSKTGANPGFPRGHKPIIRPKFHKNCTKMKKFGPRVGSARPIFYPLDPPLEKNKQDTEKNITMKKIPFVFTFISFVPDKIV